MKSIEEKPLSTCKKLFGLSFFKPNFLLSLLIPYISRLI